MGCKLGRIFLFLKSFLSVSLLSKNKEGVMVNGLVNTVLVLLYCCWWLLGVFLLIIFVLLLYLLCKK
jgi:hypothetical protein